MYRETAKLNKQNDLNDRWIEKLQKVNKQNDLNDGWKTYIARQQT